MQHTTRKSLTIPAALALVFAMTACGSDAAEEGVGGDATNLSAAGPDTTVQESAVSETTLASAAQSSSEARADDAELDELRVLIDGEPVEADLSPAICQWGEDDGVEQLEFDAGRDDDGKLAVEIDMHNPPRLDDFGFDAPGEEDWEAEDHHKQSAQIGVEGDTYTVTSTVEEDDSDREAEMVAVFTCPRS
ncbi:lipoprotein LpqH [Dietzia timorensis]|uniref:Uncharacterized protein n=1 Tax=Dietzia timorensis TaxID=499555 RepID=A0A173LPE5_9ACTN|nr:lipoprotein LpqH [Dietzia timorensis]ANI93534.1 Hypothetical protein BJL86_2774 [Dietzia timorensis]